MEDEEEITPELEAAAELYYSQYEVTERLQKRRAQLEEKHQQYLEAQRKQNLLFEEILELKRLEMLDRQWLQQTVPRGHSPDQAA